MINGAGDVAVRARFKVVRLATIDGWVAFVLGALMLITGIGHFVGVLSMAEKQGLPYNHYFALLLVTGLMMVGTGSANLLLSKWIRAGAQWARVVSASATGVLMVYLLIVRPLGSVDSTRDIGLLHAAYLILLAACFIARQRVAVHPDAGQGVASNQLRNGG